MSPSLRTQHAHLTFLTKTKKEREYQNQDLHEGKNAYVLCAYNMFYSEAVISQKEFFGLLLTSSRGGDPYKTESSLSTHHRCCPAKASSCYRRQHLG